MPSRPRLTYANVMSTIAVLLAVGTGGAYAANTIGSSDIVDESIQSVDVKNGQVKHADLAGNSVTSTNIYNGSVLGPEIHADAVTGDKVAANALTGADINESSLNLGGFFAAQDSTGSCNADGGAPTACAELSITLPRAGRVLATATGSWQTFAFDGGSTTDDATLVRGRCNLAADGTAFGLSQTMGERQQAGVASNHPPDAPGTVAVTSLSPTLSAGAHTVTLQCAEEDADLDWRNLNLTAALVGD